MITREDSLTIINGRVILDSGTVPDGMVNISGGKIAFAGPRGEAPLGQCEVIDAGGGYVSPGFIDLHVHGAAGVDFFDDGPEAAGRIAAAHARYGTTSLLATLCTAPIESMKKGIACLREAIDANGNILGIHLEGPYLNPVRRGAHSADYLRMPCRDELGALLDLGGGHVRMVTLAPELEGGLDLVALLMERSIVPAIGHSNAGVEEAEKAFSAGVRYATHLFNGMSGMHHRNPGLAAAVLADGRVTAELIVDGIHLHPLIIKMALMIKGPDGIVLVTDCMKVLDMDSDEFAFNGRKSTVRGGAPHFDDGTLCGSILTMNRAIMNMRRYTGASIEEIVMLATINPARVLGLDNCKGTLSEGKDADVVIFDDDLNVHTTIVGGKIVYKDSNHG